MMIMKESPVVTRSVIKRSIINDDDSDNDNNNNNENSNSNKKGVVLKLKENYKYLFLLNTSRIGQRMYELIKEIGMKLRSAFS